jgi:SNARE domain
VLHQEHLLPGFSESTHAHGYSIEILTAEITRLFQETNLKLKVLGDKQLKLPPQEHALKENLRKALARQLQELSGQFRPAQRNYIIRTFICVARMCTHVCVCAIYVYICVYVCVCMCSYCMCFSVAVYGVGACIRFLSVFCRLCFRVKKFVWPLLLLLPSPTHHTPSLCGQVFLSHARERCALSLSCGMCGCTELRGQEKVFDDDALVDIDIAPEPTLRMVRVSWMVVLFSSLDLLCGCKISHRGVDLWFMAPFCLLNVTLFLWLALDVCCVQGFSEGELASLETQEQLVHERSMEIRKIAESMAELASIMEDLNMLVVDQGSLLDRIDYNLENVELSVGEGLEHVQQSAETQKKTRTKLALTILCVLIIVVCVAWVLKKVIQAAMYAV